MKLYFAPDTCSLSPHIVLRELDLPFELIRVNNRTKRSADGGDFYRVNAKGYVAALMLDDGQVITEGTAIVQYLADMRPEAGLAPPNSTFERVRLQEWLNFITCEIHADPARCSTQPCRKRSKRCFATSCDAASILLLRRWTNRRFYWEKLSASRMPICLPYCAGWISFPST